MKVRISVSFVNSLVLTKPIGSGGKANMHIDTTSPALEAWITDGVGWIRIARPDRLNALDKATRAALTRIIIDMELNETVRVIAVTGAGERAFSAGIDLKESSDTCVGKFAHPMREAERNYLEVLLEVEKPTLAAINGIAAGGGFELALACDLRIAAEGAKMGLPEATIGMGANFAAVVLPQVIPRAAAMDMLYTGRFIEAEEALRHGFLNRVVTQAKLMEEATAYAVKISQNAPLSLRRIKELAVR